MTGGGGGEFEGDGLSQTVSMTSLRSGASDASLQQAASESNGGGEETSPSGSRASTPSRARRRRRRGRMAAKATSTVTKMMLIVSIYKTAVLTFLCILHSLFPSLSLSSTHTLRVKQAD